MTGHIQLRRAEMELKKSENMIEHDAEIRGRPARTWFQSKDDKRKAKGTPPAFSGPIFKLECFLSWGLLQRRAPRSIMTSSPPKQ
jgi:hypothetical protein